MQTNQKVGKDARDIGRDQQNHAVVAPFACQEVLDRAPRLPEPAILAVHGQDVLAEVILALAEEGHERGVFGQERRVLCDGGLGFAVFHLGWLGFGRGCE